MKISSIFVAFLENTNFTRFRQVFIISLITTELALSRQGNYIPDQNFKFWNSVHSTVNRELRDGSDGRTSLTRINRNPSSALRCLRPTSVVLKSLCLPDLLLKFIYSEKATKFCEIFPLLLTTYSTYSQK